MCFFVCSNVGVVVRGVDVFLWSLFLSDILRYMSTFRQGLRLLIIVKSRARESRCSDETDQAAVQVVLLHT